MSKLNVLLVDDDEKLSGLLSNYLEQHDIVLHSEADPLKARKAIDEFSPDAIILDVMMPGKDGFEVCKELRADGIETPVIMLTARGEVTDRIVGLELGADDYMPKPFEPRELVARLRSVARRGQIATSSEVLKFDNLQIDLVKRIVVLNGNEVDMTSTEFELLKLLAKFPGKKFSRDEIMNELSGVDADAFSRSIDILVSRVRQKLGDRNEKQKYIKTAWGTGYVFTQEAK